MGPQQRGKPAWGAGCGDGFGDGVVHGKGEAHLPIVEQKDTIRSIVNRLLQTGQDRQGEVVGLLPRPEADDLGIGGQIVARDRVSESLPGELSQALVADQVAQSVHGGVALNIDVVSEVRSGQDVQKTRRTTVLAQLVFMRLHLGAPFPLALSRVLVVLFPNPTLAGNALVMGRQPPVERLHERGVCGKALLYVVSTRCLDMRVCMQEVRDLQQ